MARRSSSRRDERRNQPERRPIPPETKRGIAVVVLFAIGAVGALAFLGIAGTAGTATVNAFRAIFGLAAFLVPVACLSAAALLLREEQPALTATHALGVVLLTTATTGLLHLARGPAAATTLPDIADGGGYLGLILAPSLRALFGDIASAILLACLAAIGVLVAFRVSFDDLRRAWRAAADIARSIRLALLTAKYRARAERATDAEPFTARELAAGDQPPLPPPVSAEAAPTAVIDDQPSTINHQPSTPRVRRRRPRIDLPLNLLSNDIGKPQASDIRACVEIIRKTLEHFGIGVEMGEVSVGPTVTQFTFRPAEGVKLSRITALSNDLALALAAHPIRIEAPIPGKALVGVEVPNAKVAVVRLREALESEPFRKRTSNLTVALGKDVAGNVWLADIGRMPHLLVAGATGSGKSVMLHAIVTTLLYENGPDDLKLLLIDPKRVEFPVYNGIPHLLTPVVTDVRKTVSALKWTIAEMDRRFELLAAAQKRDLAAYNGTQTRAEERLPVIVVIVDELADLMAVAAAEVEAAIIRLAQMARAVGIHLIVATQRPSVDVLTGLIKANITSRVAFAVASSVDSRTILDTAGAEKLLGRGDMLYTSAEISKPKRLQGAFVADTEVERVVAELRARGDGAAYADDVTNERPMTEFRDGNDGMDDGDDDPLLADAKEVLLAAGKGSASLLQRRLKIGYARAARILDILERQGFIGPADGAKPREVFGVADSREPIADSTEPPDDVADEQGTRDTV